MWNSNCKRASFWKIEEYVSDFEGHAAMLNPDSDRILLVEDNPNDVEITLHAFRKNNLVHQIEVVRDGEEALEYLFCNGRYASRAGKPQPRLILLDLKLPLVDGLEVLKVIKCDPATRRIPVVVLTSSRQERDIVESYDLGVNSYIAKSLDFDEFSEAVRVMSYYWMVLNQAPK